MAKSIRSKIKRKARAEFRNTIGTSAYNENMSKVQAKLKECVDKQSLKNLDHLSAQLATPMETTTAEDQTPPAADSVNPILHAKGENKVAAAIGKKKSSRRKHKLKSAEKKESVKMQGVATQEKRRPRFFCQF